MILKTTLLAGALALTLVATPAQAAAGEWVLGLHGGTAMPSGDYGDFAKVGLMGGGSFGYAVSENVCVGVDGSFTANSAKDAINQVLTAAATLIQGAPTIVKAKVDFVQAGAYARYTYRLQGRNTAPFAVIGAGLYNVKTKLESPNENYASEVTETKFGGRAGLGLSFKAGEAVSIGVEGTYHHIATDVASKQFIGLEAGVTINLSPPK